ncbi:MAG TPA: alcohol dehydrogenase catalytic domain-containing protein [Candidatus Cybelea sp.]|nr:alcohol dehydrogenase catalytic domain-containing protein [Candidatus Cybelea sp.]
MSAAANRVAVLVAPKKIELREEPAPQAPPGGIVVGVRAALTDGTDLKTFRRGHPKMPFPTRFGHEFCGDVAAVGEGVTAFAAGDAVMCAHTGPCGQCFWCTHAQEELCESLMPAMILGAYADTIAVPERVVRSNCFLKPSNVSYVEGAFLEPLACVVHSVRLLAAHPGEIVAIAGNGAFGILHALLLMRRGVEVLLFGRRAARVELARDLGIASYDTGDAPLETTIAARTQGRGADAFVECTGALEMWERGPSLVRRGGRVSFFAGLPSAARVTFDAGRLHYDEVGVLAPFHFAPADVHAASELIAARELPLERLVSGSYPLGRIGEAFALLDAGDGMKLVIEP